MIPAKTVQEILDAVRIEEVIGDFVSLRKRGVNLLGLCPFHNEKTPSFNVSPTRNIFKCFGCGKGGDAISFLKEHESFSYPDALRWLARKYNIEIEEIERSPEQMAEQQAADSLYIVNDFALQHFQEQLFDTDEGKSVALSYFKQRGLRESTIRHFGLGYAPDQRDLLLRRAKTTGHSVDLLKKTGLCSQDATRDFFRGRVMFAIHNLSGKVAAFAGRTMSSDKTIPKYVNSPETEIYVKNKTLYGAFQAKKSIRQLDECILVEGYMDVISLYQAGIENVVASSGTSLTEGQLQLIKRNTSNLKILYDGDPAGIKAALRGLDLALEQDLNVRIALLPDGEDPDSYVQKVGSEAFKSYVDQESKDFILFKTHVLLEETKGDPIKKAGLVRDIVASIARIPDPIKRSVYLRECAGLLEVSEEALVGESNKMITTAVRKKQEKDARTPGAASDSSDNAQLPYAPVTEKSHPEKLQKRPSSGDTPQENQIIRVLLLHGTQKLPEGNTVAEYVLTGLEEALNSFDDPISGSIAKEIYDHFSATGEVLHNSHFLNHGNPDVQNLTLALMSEADEYSPNWDEKGYPLQNQPKPEFNFPKESIDSLDYFTMRKLKKMCEIHNPNRIKAAFEAGDIEEGTRCLKIQMKLKDSYNMLAKKHNIVTLP
ncbi:MAG: DNA primase [Saprospiraceae bacterium]|nr:DNA primase [Saprospiraceae bacterium]